jgi:hypothetical protein
MTYYTHPQETWTEQECAKRAKRTSHDGMGSKEPYKGKVADEASPYPSYGQTRRYNGGFIAPDGNWYNGEIKPLPAIPDTYEFYKILTWGTYIRKKG